MININKANISELITLHGIAQKKAESIIEQRAFLVEMNGVGFRNFQDVLSVSGIGVSTLKYISQEIIFSDDQQEAQEFNEKKSLTASKKTQKKDETSKKKPATKPQKGFNDTPRGKLIAWRMRRKELLDECCKMK